MFYAREKKNAAILNKFYQKRRKNLQKFNMINKYNKKDASLAGIKLWRKQKLES